MSIQSMNVMKPIEDLSVPLAEIVKGVAGPAAEIVAVENWGAGALNRCLKVKVVHPAETFFVKIEYDDILPVSRRGQVAREAASNRRMRAAGVRCPAVLDHDSQGNHFGARYLVEEFIDAPLVWEVRERLTPSEHELLQADILEVLAKMRSVTSPLYGDVYPGGWIGQFEHYPDYFRRAWSMDLADCQALDLFTPAEVEIASAAAGLAANRVANRPAAFYHGDLGMHNLLARQAPTGLSLGWVIDFGNALFLPGYQNEDGVRRHGGFGLKPRPGEDYGVGPAEQAAEELLGMLNWIAFSGMLWRSGRWDRSPREPIAQWIAMCKGLTA